METKAQKIAAAIIGYIAARDVRYADRDRALLAAHKGLIEALDEALAPQVGVTFIGGAISDAYAAGWRPEGFAGLPPHLAPCSRKE